MTSPVCLWHVDGCDWSIAAIWSSWDLIEHGIFLVLALMLGYTVFVFIRFWRRYPFVRRELHNLTENPCHAPNQNPATLVADLGRGLQTLKGIVSAAPLLGLAGTSYGILAGLSRAMNWLWHGPWSMVPVVAQSEITCAFGILVALLALICHNVLRLKVDILRCLFPNRRSAESSLGSFQFAQTLALKKRFSTLPPLALIGAPVIACALSVWMGFRIYPLPTGLFVHLMPIDHAESAKTSEQPIVVSITAAGDFELPTIRVQNKSVTFDSLAEVVREQTPKKNEPQVYVEAESAVYWAQVTNAVDRLKGARCRVTLLSSRPATTGQSTGRRK